MHTTIIDYRDRVIEAVKHKLLAEAVGVFTLTETKEFRQKAEELQAEAQMCLRDLTLKHEARLPAMEQAGTATGTREAQEIIEARLKTFSAGQMQEYHDRRRWAEVKHKPDTWGSQEIRDLLTRDEKRIAKATHRLYPGATWASKEEAPSVTHDEDRNR